MSGRRATGVSVRTLQGLLILGIVFGALGALLAYRAAPVPSYAAPVGPMPTSTPTKSDWQGLIATQFLFNATPLPTADADATYVPPTPAWGLTTPAAFAPIQIAGVRITPTIAELANLPTQTPTRGPSPTPTARARAAAPTPTQRSDWNPPPMIGPLSLDPRDHFWLHRPIQSDRVNYGLLWYHYGSNGLENNMRTHRGEDFSNPRGVNIVAAGDGTVIWAANGIQTVKCDTGRPEHITSYGNVMVVEHDFSYRGQPVYTLYAHLSAFTRQPGDRVEAGDVIGLVGATGLVGGPHLHFEVRIGCNAYGYTRNPMLWVAPYVGTGVIAGRVVDAGGQPVQDNDVTLIDKSTGRVVGGRRTTYNSGVNPDDEWNENFVFPDVEAGEYRVVTWVGGERLSVDVTAIPGTTSFVELWGTRQGVPATPQNVIP